tara:strand:+ start:564 stop:713 length:150 start_codon:yes stop_codon:yes gene_type:complete
LKKKNLAVNILVAQRVVAVMAVKLENAVVAVVRMDAAMIQIIAVKVYKL